MLKKLSAFFLAVIMTISSLALFSCGNESAGGNDNNVSEIQDNSAFAEDNQTETTAKELEEITESQKLIKTHDEKHNRYNFAYKRSTLSIRKEIFDEYNLTDEHIQKFFDGAETAYDKLGEFFFDNILVHEVFHHHAVPKEFSEPDLYLDYQNILSMPHPRGGTIAGLVAYPYNIYYEETVVAKFLSMIDIGFPSLVAHELGHHFNTIPNNSQGFFIKSYVWDRELFADLAAYYLASEFTVITFYGIILTYNQSGDFYWDRFFGLVEKYGYNKMSDTFKVMMPLMQHGSPLDGNEEARFELFKKVLTQETGDDINDYYATDFITIQGKHYDTAFAGNLLLNFANLEDSDIEPLRHMVNLSHLNLYGNKITDISPLADLTNLKFLSLQDNQIADISVLAGLPNLTELILGGNQFIDISVLAGLTNLTTLELSRSQISDISVLAGLTNLTKLYLWENQITDISVLAGLQDLTDLVLANNQISNIEPLKKMVNLTILSLDGNQITDISTLTELTNLTSLGLRGNPISAEQIAELREALPNTEIYADH